jgi:hypothetical protein
MAQRKQGCLYSVKTELQLVIAGGKKFTGSLTALGHRNIIISRHESIVAQQRVPATGDQDADKKRTNAT